MGSDSCFKLPFLNFSNPELIPGTPDWDALKSQVREAVEEYGCFEASLDKIPSKFRTSVLESLQEFFDLPVQTKQLIASKIPFNGYVGQCPRALLRESVFIEDAHVPKQIETVTNQLWPEGNFNFSKTIQSYSVQLVEFDQIIRRMIVESFGMEKYMDEHLSCTKYILRVLKFTGPQTDETQVGMGCHTDKSMVTILHQNQVHGLEVQTKDGRWIKVEPSPNSYTVVIGDSLHAWLNGRVHVPIHRVMVSGNETRYSFGLFGIPKAGYIVKAPEGMVDEQHPLLFKPFDYMDYYSYCDSRLGKIEPFPLKAYCGIRTSLQH